MSHSHFIGYWSQNSPCFPNNYLRKVTPSLTDASILTSPHLSPYWQVCYLGKINQVGTPLLGEIARLSVSGLPQPEAWVRVNGNHLILGREIFGRVPLYWMQQDQQIWFSTQLQLLLCLMPTPQVNLAGLYGYTCFSYVPTPFTPVVGISGVAAGEELIFSVTEDDPTPKQIKRQIQFQWQEAPIQLKNEQTAIDQLQTLLKAAIHRQLDNLPGEPVGVFLSGGLDSATIAALLVQAGIQVRAYTLDFGLNASPELPYAQRVAQFLQIPLTQVSASPRRIQQALQATVTALDLPFGDGVTVPLYLLCQAASEEVACIFNGEGGDQLFAGWTNKPMIAVGLYNSFDFDQPDVLIQQYLKTFHRLWGYEAQIFQPAVYHKIQGINPQICLQETLDLKYCTGLLHRLRRGTLMLKGAQNIHPRASYLAISQGLCLRSPFCDLPLAKWTFQLPGEFYLKGSCEKYILKRAVASWLPPEVVWREKRGMGVPLTAWCLNQLWSNVGYWLNPGVLKAEGRFQPNLAQQIIQGEISGQIRGRRIGEILWLLMQWQIWRTTILGEQRSGQTALHPFLIPYQCWKWFKNREV